jgi:predicted RNA binding protein with dsRBD fold (UPF0201 family)
MTNQIELTTKKTSYVHSLFEHRDEITKKFESKQVNTNQLKQFVREIVINTNSKTVDNKSQSTKRFLMYLDKQTSKVGVVQLVWNSMMKGDGLGVC